MSSISDLRHYFYGTPDEELAFLQQEVDAGGSLAQLTALNKKPVSGTYFGGSPDSTSTATALENIIYASPLPLLRKTSFDRIRAEVTTAAADSTLHLGIYQSHESESRPDELVADTGTIDGNTVAVQDITIDLELDAGLYWLAALAKGGAPIVRGYSGASMYMASDSLPAVRRTSYHANSVDGLPATYPFVATSLVSAPPRVLLRVA